MISDLDSLIDRFSELNKLLSDVSVISDNKRYAELSKEHSDLAPVVEKYKIYKKVLEEIKDSKDLLEVSDDQDMKELAEEELNSLKEQEAILEKEIRVLLIPKDPSDSKNIILEVRAGTGGDEAALFAGNLFTMYQNEAGLFAADLFRMYNYYAEKNNWSVEIMSSSPTGVGGYKEIIALVKGKNVYSRLKFEGGTHRVQRVPKTEAGGRVHTSAATVAVLAEVDEVDVDIKSADLKIDVYRASGPGGQCVNTTDSAVRITHLPSGVVVTCQDEKSQHKNKAKAMKILSSRIYEQKKAEADAERASERKDMIGSGDRSARIRTYNFPQGRITDHRISLTLYKLDQFLTGDLDEMIESIITYYNTEHLKNIK